MLLVALALASVSTLTVDDDGPAQFQQIADAIQAAQPGDLVLVEDGTYSPFALDKALTILGHGGAHVTGLSTVQSVSSVALAGLRFDRLGVHDVSGRAVLDELEIAGVLYAPPTPGLFIESCSEVIATRLDCRAPLTVGTFKPDSLRVRGSSLSLVDSSVLGASGEDCFSIACNGFAGGVGLHAMLSTLVVAGSQLEGGGGGLDLASTFGGLIDGLGGAGLWLQSSSASLQGNALTGGLAPGCFDPCEGNAYTVADSQLVLGGLALSGPIAATASTAVVPDPFEPWIEISGATGLGLARRLDLYAPLGEPCVAALSVQSALEPWALGGAQPPHLWLDPSALLDVVGLVGAGATVAASHIWIQPATPALAGLALTVQVAGLEVATGKIPLSNPAAIVLGF
jgi:hypothetical protein